MNYNPFNTCHYSAQIKSAVSVRQVIDLKHQIRRTACASGLQVSNLSGRAGRLVDALKRPTQRVLADHFVHAQRLRGHRVTASPRGAVMRA